MSILVVGAAFVDIKGFPTDGYMPTGRNVGRIEYIHGGVARNVVEDIANMELRPTYLGMVDDSPMGADVLQKLKNHKVNCDYVMTVPDGMGTWLAVFDTDGEVAGSISKRPNMLPLVDLLEKKGDEIFAQVSSVVLECDLDKELVKKVLSLAEKHGKTSFALVSNMSLAVERRDLLRRFDYVICNQQEAGLLFMEDYADKSADEMQEILTKKVSQAKVHSLVVTLGSEGAVYADENGNSGFCPAKKVQVKDTTGAGDAFCAGFSAAITGGKSMEAALEIGTLLAASVITSTDNVCPRFQPAELGLATET